MENRQSSVTASLRIRVSDDTQYDVALALKRIEQTVLVAGEAMPTGSAASAKASAGVSSEK